MSEGLSKGAEMLYDQIKTGDNQMVVPSTLLYAAQLVGAGLCTVYSGHDGELYLQAKTEISYTPKK
jgi:hypothetical protein